MSSIITRMLRETGVYWASPVPDGFGNNAFDTAIEIKVRWEDKNENFIDADGEERVSAAKVFVDRDLDTGGYLFRGFLVDLADPSNPEVIKLAKEIRRYDRIPNSETDEFLRRAWLV